MKNLLFILSFSFLVLSFQFCYADWEQTNGPYGKNVQCLAISGKNIFAGTLNEGIFLSSNNGGSWKAVNNGLTDLSILSLAIGDTNIFAGTTEGIFLSTNNGTNWTAANNGLSNTVVWSLVISDTNIFAGTQGGVFLSTDIGASWIAMNSGLTDVDIWSLAICDTNIFAGTYNGGVFLSTNLGASWFPINNGISNSASVRPLTISGTNTFAGINSEGVFLSTNNGTSWTVINNGLNYMLVYSFAISNKNIFAGTGFYEYLDINYHGGVFLFINNYESWIDVSKGFPENIYVYYLAINRDTIYAGTNSGVWKRPLSEMLGINELKSENEKLEIKISPNPMNELSVISYQLSEKSFVCLKVFDITDRKVTTLINEIKEKGEYNLKYNADGLKRGVYFIRLVSDDGVRVVKFVKE